MAQVKFCFHGKPQQRSRHGLVARLQNWKDYYDWGNGAVELASRLHGEIVFDLAHHVTMASWRMGSILRFCRIPFVFGPVGGGEHFPVKLLSTVSWQSAVFEFLRRMVDIIGMLSPSVKLTLKTAKYVLAANEDTAKLMTRLGADPQKMRTLNPAFLPMEFPKHYKNFKEHEPLLLFGGGEIEGRKGFALALQALKKFKSHGIPFRYVIGGAGAEMAYLQRLISNLGLHDQVTIGRYFSGEEYRSMLASTDIYLLPSLRDSAPVTLLEAMAFGCIPVVADCGGPSVMVGEFGYRIMPAGVDQMTNEIVSVLLDLSGNQNKRKKMSIEVSRHAWKAFSEQNYRDAISQVYRKSIG